MFKRFCQAILFSVVLVMSANSQEIVPKAAQAEIDKLLLDRSIRSISVGVIRKGQSYTFHRGKLLNGKTPTNKTLYEIASLTKTFTGTLFAKAMLDKKVGIDDDIRKYLPNEFPDLEFGGNGITFRSLFTHTSGLPQMFPNRPEIFEKADWDRLPSEINSLQSGFTKDQFLEELRKVRLDTAPGTKFSYSNVGANLVAYCLESIYKESYAKLVKQQIFEPLRMKHSSVGFGVKTSTKVVRGTNANGIVMPLRAQKQLSAEGGIVSTLEDMLRYLEFHLKRDDQVVRLSHQELLGGKYGEFENGLFWQILKPSGKPTKIFQNGGAFGTSSWVTLLPDSNTAVILITNTAGADIHQKLNNAADNILSSMP